jgi:hypothetical protein
MSKTHSRSVLRLELAIRSSLPVAPRPYVLETRPIDCVVVQAPTVQISGEQLNVHVQLHDRQRWAWVDCSTQLPALPLTDLAYEYRGNWACLSESDDPFHPRWGSDEWDMRDVLGAALILVSMRRRQKTKKPSLTPNLTLPAIISIEPIQGMNIRGKRAFYVTFASGIQAEVMPWTKFLISKTEFHPAFIWHLCRSSTSREAILAALGNYADEHLIGLKLQLLT